MVRSKWKRTFFSSLAWAGLALGQVPGASAAAPSPVGRVISVQENGKPSQKCKVLKAWTMPGGSQAYEVQDVQTGEMLTILEGSPLATAPGSGIRAVTSRIFRWGRNQERPPVGVPTAPSAIVQAPPPAMTAPDLSRPLPPPPATGISAARPGVQITEGPGPRPMPVTTGTRTPADPGPVLTTGMKTAADPGPVLTIGKKDVEDRGPVPPADPVPLKPAPRQVATGTSPASASPLTPADPGLKWTQPRVTNSGPAVAESKAAPSGSSRDIPLTLPAPGKQDPVPPASTMSDKM